MGRLGRIQGLNSLSGKTSYRQISCSLEAAILDAYHSKIWQKMHFGSAAAEVAGKFQSEWTSLNPNFAASRLREILW